MSNAITYERRSPATLPPLSPEIQACYQGYLDFLSSQPIREFPHRALAHNYEMTRLACAYAAADKTLPHWQPGTPMPGAIIQAGAKAARNLQPFRSPLS